MSGAQLYSICLSSGPVHMKQHHPAQSKCREEDSLGDIGTLADPCVVQHLLHAMQATARSHWLQRLHHQLAMAMAMAMAMAHTLY